MPGAINTEFSLGKMEAIKETVKGLMQKWKSQKKLSIQDEPFIALKKALKKKEREHIRFNYFRNGILGIGVDSSAWLYALNLQKEALLNKSRLKSDVVIKEIRFSLGEAR